MTKQRYLWVDIAKFMAIFFVILNHVNEKFNLNQPYPHNSAILFELLGRLGVPLFLIISGYLMLNRNYTDDGKLHKFVHHNMLPMISSAILWTVILSFYTYFMAPNATWKSLFKNLFFQNPPMPQMWYIQLLPIVYVLIPILSLGKNYFKNYIAAIFSIGAVLLGFGSLGASFTGNRFVPFQWNMSGSWGLVFIMLAFFVFGSFLNELVHNKKTFILLICTTFVALALFVINTKQLTPAGILANIWYTQAWVFIPGALLTLLLQYLITKFELRFTVSTKVRHFLATISQLTFGVYIIHYVVLHLLLESNLFDSESSSILLVTMTTLIISLIVVWLFVKIPKFPKFVFLTK